jgi:hypothetical protein
MLLFLELFNVDDLRLDQIMNFGNYSLSDVVSRTSNATDFDEHKVICQKVSGKFSHGFGERGAEHECLPWNYRQMKTYKGRTILGDIGQDLSNFRFEAHVKHPIRLIQDKITIVKFHRIQAKTTEHDQDRFYSSSWHPKDAPALQ